MLRKRWILGLGAITLVLASFLGVACNEEEENGGTPTATQPADETPEADQTPETDQTPQADQTPEE